MTAVLLPARVVERAGPRRFALSFSAFAEPGQLRLMARSLRKRSSRRGRRNGGKTYQHLSDRRKPPRSDRRRFNNHPVPIADDQITTLIGLATTSSLRLPPPHWASVVYASPDGPKATRLLMSGLVRRARKCSAGQDRACATTRRRLRWVALASIDPVPNHLDGSAPLPRRPPQPRLIGPRKLPPHFGPDGVPVIAPALAPDTGHNHGYRSVFRPRRHTSPQRNRSTKAHPPHGISFSSTYLGTFQEKRKSGLPPPQMLRPRSQTRILPLPYFRTGSR